MKIDEHNRIVILIVILATVLSAFVYFYGKSIARPYDQNNSKITSENPYQTYTSKSLKFAVDIPKGYIVKEVGRNVKLSKKNEEIDIGQSGTNFTTLTDHVDNLLTVNKLVVLSKEDIQINDYSAVKTLVKGVSKEEKIYLIRPDDWLIFSISTSSMVLYDELDQIAGSFRYIGNAKNIGN